ncbi:foldase protein PrsA [Natranaerobius trueperi]|uniref:PpiC domain-containing protein n=1 Tax=Natranaerobius trueperi TaxID=759412 RepID=A0A226BXY4_9FIRM|nr:peptidylprolyl isomerase [Natranaerobius trueperi]OWZ83873.1 hypothetical protein CDO51_06465 [Natranaerobius trueperi]
MNKVNKQMIGIVLTFLLSLMFLSACSSENQDNDELDGLFSQVDASNFDKDIIAEFEDGKITDEEFITFLSVQAFLYPDIPINEPDVQRQILEELILEKTVSPLVKETDWAEKQAEILLDELKSYYSEKELDYAYETLDITKEDIKETLVSMFTAKAHFRDQVSEDEKLEYYEEKSDELTIASFTHILVMTEDITSNGKIEEVRSEEKALKKADDLYDQLQDGADINELAASYTDDTGSVDTDGYYEDVYISDLVPEFRDAILEQEIGEIGEPVKTEYGYHILRVEDIEVTPFEEVIELITDELAYNKYADYFIDTLPDLIEEINL